MLKVDSIKLGNVCEGRQCRHKPMLKVGLVKLGNVKAGIVDISAL